MLPGFDPVFEKRIRPIYESIDRHNFKQALKLCDSTLQKQDYQLVRALRSLALDKLGRNEEALKELSDLKEKKPTDETVLSTMYLSYRGLGKLSESTECYQEAYKKFPGRPDLAESLFFSFVREMRFKDQQLQASSLLKTFPKDERYNYWFIASIYQQIPSDAAPDNLLLNLVATLLRKSLAEKKLNTMEKFLFFLDVLDRQGNQEESLALIEKYIISPVESSSKDAIPGISEKRREYQLTMLIDRLLILGDWAKALPLLKELLANHCPDDWHYYQQLIKCAFKPAPQVPSSKKRGRNRKLDDAQSKELKDRIQAHLDAGNEYPPGDVVVRMAKDFMGKDFRFTRADASRYKGYLGFRGEPTTSVADLTDFINTVEESDNGRVCRGPRLARLYLLQRRITSGDPDKDQLIQEYQDRLVSFFEKFGDKPVAFYDLRLFLAAPFFSGLVASFIDRLTALLTDQFSPQDPSHLKNTFRFLTVHKLQLTFGLFNDETEAQNNERIEKYTKIFKEWSADPAEAPGRASNASDNQSEVQNGDEFLLLIVWDLITKSRKAPVDQRSTEAFVFLLKALHLLQYGIKISPNNFHFKLCTIFLLRQLAGVSESFKLYKALSIKYIQHDTMGWLIHSDLVNQAFSNDATSNLSSALSFYNESLKDLQELITLPYRHGSYTRVPEFSKLVEKINHSLQHHIFSLDSVWLNIFLKGQPDQIDGAVSKLSVDLSALQAPEKFVAIDTRDFAFLAGTPFDWSQISPDHRQPSNGYFVPAEDLKAQVVLQLGLLRKLKAFVHQNVPEFEATQSLISSSDVSSLPFSFSLLNDLLDVLLPTINDSSLATESLSEPLTLLIARFNALVEESVADSEVLIDTIYSVQGVRGENPMVLLAKKSAQITQSLSLIFTVLRSLIASTTQKSKAAASPENAEALRLLKELGQQQLDATKASGIKFVGALEKVKRSIDEIKGPKLEAVITSINDGKNGQDPLLPNLPPLSQALRSLLQSNLVFVSDSIDAINSVFRSTPVPIASSSSSSSSGGGSVSSKAAKKKQKRR